MSRWNGERMAAELRSVRKLGGFSIDELADFTGVGWSEMSRWARGEHRPDPDALRRLVLGVVLAHPTPMMRSLASRLCTAAGHGRISSDLGLRTTRDR